MSRPFMDSPFQGEACHFLDEYIGKVPFEILQEHLAGCGDCGETLAEYFFAYSAKVGGEYCQLFGINFPVGFCSNNFLAAWHNGEMAKLEKAR